MVENNSRILLLFPDGVGIRNYLYSDVFKNTASELVLFHNFNDETEADIKERTGIDQALKIPRYNESPKEKFLRELICLSRLRYNAEITGNKTILTNWKSSHNGFSKKLFYKAIECIAPLFKKYERILRLEKQYQDAIRKNPFYDEVKKLLQEIQPDALFCSHQRSLHAPTVFAVAKDLGIPTTTVVFSWDNLPKARMALRADKYLVWSDYMKQELFLYYPEIPESAVYVTGTPQFEFYGKSDMVIESEVFYRIYNLDPNKRIICYSGDDVKTSPDDPTYLDDLARELCKSGLDKEYQILLRRCPIDLSGRFESVVSKYSGLIKEAPPLWLFKTSSEWSSVYPRYEDVSLLVSTAYYSDVVVNVGSTMAFDFAMFNKPCIFINYDQPVKKDKKWSVRTIYQYQHFMSMPSKEAVLWLNDPREIIGMLGTVDCGPMMKEWKKTVVADFKNASAAISSLLINN